MAFCWRDIIKVTASKFEISFKSFGPSTVALHLSWPDSFTQALIDYISAAQRGAYHIYRNACAKKVWPRETKETFAVLNVILEIQSYHVTFFNWCILQLQEVVVATAALKSYR